jgi:Stress responsive A/B Barrel Domain
MIAHVCLYKLQPEVTEDKLEEMMSRTRVLLLRVPEILVVRTGKRTHEEDQWQWFIMMEVESLDKLAIVQDDPHFIKFREEVLKPNVSYDCIQDYEMEPRKNVRYS